MLADPTRHIYLLTYMKDLCNTYLQPINLNLKPYKPIYLFNYKVVLVINSLTPRHVIGYKYTMSKVGDKSCETVEFKLLFLQIFISNNLNMEQYTYLNILHNYTILCFQMYIWYKNLLFKHEYIQTFTITKGGDGSK
jgi:hypothetical protein